jgi:peptidyl-tRNA hydrolase
VPNGQIVDETAAHRPRHRKDIYALAKIAAEADLRMFCRNSGLKAAILQPTMIFGPYSHEWTLAPLSMLQHSNIAMPEADRSVCNAVYVDDVASAAFLAANACDANCDSYIINGKDLLTWSEYLSRHADLGSLGKIVKVSSERLDQLRAEAAKSRSFSRMLVNLIRTEPRFRAAILSNGLAASAYSLIQKYASAGMMMALRAKMVGKQESGPRTVRFARPPELPLRLPPQHFLDLARQSHRFSTAKGAQVLGFAPVYSVDTALPILRAWAKWARLVRHDVADVFKVAV